MTRTRTLLLAALFAVASACAPAEPSPVPPTAAGEPPPAEPGVQDPPSDLVAVLGSELELARYGCDGPPGFQASLFDGPATAELDDHPSAQILREAIAAPGPDLDALPPQGYWLVHRDDAQAHFIARGPGVDPDPPFVSAQVVAQDDGWTLGGWGQCRPNVVLDGLSPASWTLDPAGPAPDADSTDLPILVTETACTGGSDMGARLLAPVVVEDEDAVRIVFAAVPLEGDAFECQGNPSSRVVVRLDRPLGDRRLLDAGTFPYAEPLPAS